MPPKTTKTKSDWKVTYGPGILICVVGTMGATYLMGGFNWAASTLQSRLRPAQVAPAPLAVVSPPEKPVESPLFTRAVKAAGPNFTGTIRLTHKTFSPTGSLTGGEVWDYEKQGTVLHSASAPPRTLHELPSRSRAIERWKQGNLAAVTNHPQEAAKAFQSAIVADPLFAEAYNNYGIILYGLGDYKKAYANFQEAVRLDPDSINYRINLINSLAYTSALPGSPEFLQVLRVTRIQAQELIKRHPENEDGYVALAAGDMNAQPFSAAKMKIDIEHVSQHHPQAGQVDSLNGYLAAKQGNMQEAIQDYQKATKQKPFFPHCYLQWAIAENSLGHPQKAIDLLIMALAQAPYLRSLLQQPEFWGSFYHDPQFQALVRITRSKDSLPYQSVPMLPADPTPSQQKGLPSNKSAPRK